MLLHHGLPWQEAQETSRHDHPPFRKHPAQACYTAEWRASTPLLTRSPAGLCRRPLLFVTCRVPCSKTYTLAHQDCFYASVFENESPHLKTLPLAVQQKQIIVTCNYTARSRVSWLPSKLISSLHILTRAGPPQATTDLRSEKTLSRRGHRPGRGSHSIQKCLEGAVRLSQVLLLERALREAWI
jgi:hypothetical protein